MASSRDHVANCHASNNSSSLGHSGSSSFVGGCTSALRTLNTTSGAAQSGWFRRARRAARASRWSGRATGIPAHWRSKRAEALAGNCGLSRTSLVNHWWRWSTAQLRSSSPEQATGIRTSRGSDPLATSRWLIARSRTA